METIADFVQWIKAMRSELGQQVIAVKKLALAFSEGDIQLVRHDQVVRLRILKSRIMREVEDIKRMESAAQMRSTGDAFLGAGAAFTFGSLFLAAKGRQDASRIGLKLAISTLSKTVPFGTVLIAVGKGGLPEDLTIIPVSRFARQSNKTEPEVEVSLKHDGYLLMTPQVFTQVLDKVKREVLDGSFSLPINIDKLTKQIPEGC